MGKDKNSRKRLGVGVGSATAIAELLEDDTLDALERVRVAAKYRARRESTADKRADYNMRQARRQTRRGGRTR